MRLLVVSWGDDLGTQGRKKKEEPVEAKGSPQEENNKKATTGRRGRGRSSGEGRAPAQGEAAA